MWFRNQHPELDYDKSREREFFERYWPEINKNLGLDIKPDDFMNDAILEAILAISRKIK